MNIGVRIGRPFSRTFFVSFSPRICEFESQQNFRLAKPFSLASQKLCYFQMLHDNKEEKKKFLTTVGEYGLGTLLKQYDVSKLGLAMP